MSSADARTVAAATARESFGRLVALLASTNRDIALAEDAVSAAFEQALQRWPETGVPDNPEGWLLTVARNRQRDVWRAPAYRSGVEWDDSHPLPSWAPLDEIDPDAIGDRRLELLFACAHPAIDAAVRTPLMLQSVLGFQAAQIAAAYGMPTATLAQRLVRAKRRIRDAGIPLAVPGRQAMPERLPAVLEAVYGCYAIAWRDADGAGHARPDSFAGEALYLAVTLATLLGDEPEAWGLASLIALSLSRARARGGGFLPLDEQDPALWDADLISEGEGYLARADALGATPGRFRLEAAMQAVHAARARTGVVDEAALLLLARALVVVGPTAGAHIELAVLTGRHEGADAGLALLAELPPDAKRLGAFHAARGDLLDRADRRSDASAAFAEAAEREPDPATAAYLRGRASAVADDPRTQGERVAASDQHERLVGVLDVGGSHVTGALARCSGTRVTLLEQVSSPLDSAGACETVLTQLTAPAIALSRGAATTAGPAGVPSAWVVAMPGPFDYVHGRGDFAGVAKFGSIAGVDLRTELSRRLAVPPQQVGFVNDAAAYGIGEWTATSDSISERPGRFVCLTLGTGVGSVYLDGGQPVDSGSTVPPHGWAHLLTFAGRPLEDTVSTRAITADYQRRSQLATPVEVRSIAEAARGGDVHARAALIAAMEALGVALAPWLGRFAADQVVVGGAMSQSWDLLATPLRRGLERAGPGRALPELRRAVLLGDAPLLGAAEWFRTSWSPSLAPTP